MNDCRQMSSAKNSDFKKKIDFPVMSASKLLFTLILLHKSSIIGEQLACWTVVLKVEGLSVLDHEPQLKIRWFLKPN